MENFVGVIIFAVVVLTVLFLIQRARKRTEQREAEIETRLDSLEQQVTAYESSEQR